MSLWSELERRNVLRVGASYAVVAWLLVQVAATILPMFGAPDWLSRALVIALAVAFLPTLLLAWRFEWTEAGLVSQRRSDASGTTRAFGGQRLPVALAALALVALALFALGRYTAPPSLPAPNAAAASPAPAHDTGPSIAVLPFVNMSADRDNEYFSDGLSGTLLDMLAQVPALKVPARTSSFAFKGKAQDVREIAGALGVAHLLEGSVQKAGDQVRITAQLVRASDGTHVWSRRFDRRLTDVFAIQDEIATEVVAALKVALIESDGHRLTQKRTDSLDAYQAYLRGVALMPQRRVADLGAAIAQFERALTLDPAFAKAYVGASDAYRLLADYGSVSQEEQDRAERYVARALELAPELGEAHVSLGAMRVDQRDYAGAERAYRRGIELAPSYATAHHWYGELLREHLQRFEQALAEAQRAAELDPLSPIVRYSLAENQAAAGRVAEGRATIAALVQAHPQFPLGHETAANIAASEGDLVSALRATQAHMRSDPDAIRAALGRCRLLIQFHALQEAGECVRRQAAATPDFPAVLQVQADLELRAGRAAESLRLHRLPRPGDRDPVGMALALWALKQPEEALAELRAVLPYLFREPPPTLRTNARTLALVSSAMLIETGAVAQGKALALKAIAPPDPSEPQSLKAVWPWLEAVGHELLGERDAAFAALQQGVSQGRFVDLNDLEWPPQLAAMRADPRFERIVAPARAEAARQLALARQAGLL